MQRNSGGAGRVAGTDEVRSTVKVEAWLYAMLLFNSAVLAVQFVSRVASLFE